MADTMEQAVRSGLAFNPLAAEDGQGETYVGANQNRLQEVMVKQGWTDLRFLTERQVVAAGWTVKPGAVPVQIVFKDIMQRWDNKVLFNASEVNGIPSLESMLEVAKNRLPPSVDVAHDPVQDLPFLVFKEGKAHVYSADGRNELLPQWTGLVVDGSDTKKLWYIGQDDGERSFDLVPTSQYQDAVAWAEEQERLAELRGKEVVELADIEIADDEPALTVGPAKREVEKTVDLEEVVSIAPVFRTKTIGDEGAEHIGEPKVDYFVPTLLGKTFKEREPGSGEYVREGEKKVAFLDKGGSLVVRDKQADCYQAVMELAKSKGWEAIELSGKPEHIARGWLEAQLIGIEVANYTPNEEDLAALDARREEIARAAMAKTVADQEAADQVNMDRAAAERAAALADPEDRVPDGAKAVTVGRFIGTVSEITDGYVIQSSGPGTFVAHKLSDFAQPPKIGALLDVDYRGGKAIEQKAKLNSREIGAGREIGGR